MSIELFLGYKRSSVYKIPERIESYGEKEYEVGERIASGGNAVIHKCIERISGNDFAIKFQLSISENRLRRFQREIDLLRKVKHDQLMSYVDHGVVKSRIKKEEKVIPFLVMPIADENLKDRLINQKSRPIYDEYISQFKGLAEALGVLHKEAIHRDIKPENVLISGETWILSDFGLCKFSASSEELSAENEPIGPRFWMSPEAVNRAIGNEDNVEKSSDVYQLCCIFWYVVTGRNPCGWICFEDWGGPKELFEVIYPALAHDPEKRPKDGFELLQLLNKIAPSHT